MFGRLTVSLVKTNRTTSGPAAIGERAKDVAAQAIPVGKTAVQGVRQGVLGAKEWAAPRLEDAVQSAKEWAAPRLEDAVTGAREWAAPRLEVAADAVDTTVAPKVSSALRSTAAQVRPSGTKRTGIRRLLDWRLLLGVGAAMAAAGAGAAITMRRRYASATAEAKNSSESSEDERGAQAGESDTAAGSEVNGRVTTPGM
jgi:hypothetical protein